MATQNVLFIPGAGDPKHPQGSGHLAGYLARELGDAFRVVAPDMPNPTDPDYASWRDVIAEQLSELGANPLLVGHSLGASVLLKYLAQGTYQHPIDGLFLIATPFWGPDLPDFALPDHFEAAVRDIPTFLYHSRDDAEIPVAHLRRYQEHLPNATSRLIEGSEHSFVAGLPELVRDIQSSSAISSNTG